MNRPAESSGPVPEANQDLRELCRFISGTQAWDSGAGWAQAPAAAIAYAREQGLGALLHHRLAAAGESARPLADRLREASIAAAKRSLALEAEIHAFTRLLFDAGTPFLLIKGAALAYSIYPSPALRPRADTDILVDPADAGRVRELLSTHGYDCEPLVEPLRRGQYLTTQFICRRSDPAGNEFDVHWRINNSTALGRLLSFDELAGGSMPLPALQARIRAPALAHGLLIACIHWAGERAKRLIWLYDLHLLNERMTGADWAKVLSVAAERRCASLVAFALAQGASCFGTPFPQEALAGLRSLADRRPREAVRLLVAPGGHARARAVDFMALGWAERVRLLSAVCFPPAAYLRLQRREHAPLPRSRLLWHYLARPFRALGRHAGG